MHTPAQIPSRLAIVASIAVLSTLGAPRAFAQAHDIAAIQNLKCLTNDTIAVGAPFPASLRGVCNRNDSLYRVADTAIAADNFRITYNPFGNLGPVAGDAACVGPCQGGSYVRNASPDQDFKNVRVSEGSATFLGPDSGILGEDVIVHLPRGFNGPREHEQGLANGAGSRDIVVMLHGGGGLGEAALSQLANLKSIQDLPGSGPVLLIPNAGNHLRAMTHQWAWDGWSTACQTNDSAKLGASTPVRFRSYSAQNPADSFDDGFDDACTPDLRRLLKLVYDLKTSNKWIRRVVLAGFSSGGNMTKTVLCTYPGAYDGYALFEHGKLIGAPGQPLCGDLDQGSTGYARFLSRRLDSLIGIPPEDLAAAKRPLFQVCSDQDDACSDDLGSIWKIANGKATEEITDLATELRVIDHTEVTDRTRDSIALVRAPDSADLSTLGNGQYSWKSSGLEFRAQTTLASNLPRSIGSLVADKAIPPVCADTGARPGNPGFVYDASFCSFADANTGGGSTAADDKTFHSVLAIGQLGESVVNPLEDITAVRYVEKRNGGAYGYIEVHGGAHTIHGANLRADFGKTRDFETFVELLKFMNYAYSGPTSIGKGSKKRAFKRRGISPAFYNVMRFDDRNALGRRMPTD